MTFLLSVWISNREKILRDGYQMQKCKILFASQTPILDPAEVDSLENRVSLNKLNVHSLAVRGRRQSIKWQYISSRFEYCQHTSLSLPWLYILYNHYWSQSHSPPLLNLKTGPSWALVDGSWPLSKHSCNFYFGVLCWGIGWLIFCIDGYFLGWSIVVLMILWPVGGWLMIVLMVV